MTNRQPPPRLPEEDHTRPITPNSATQIIEPPIDAHDTPPRGMPPPRRHRDNPFYVPLWAIGLMLFFVFTLAASLILMVIILGGSNQAAAPQPILTVIAVEASPTPALPELALPVPTITAVPPTPLTTPEAIVELQGPTLIPTSTYTPTPISIGVGATVIVITERLNIRSSPGTDNAVNRVIFTAREGQLFTVLDGPVEADGLRFWKIGDSLINIEGWAAENDNQQDLLRVFVP
jgi:hypothetical protein